MLINLCVSFKWKLIFISIRMELHRQTSVFLYKFSLPLNTTSKMVVDQWMVMKFLERKWVIWEWSSIPIVMNLCLLFNIPDEFITNSAIYCPYIKHAISVQANVIHSPCLLVNKSYTFIWLQKEWFLTLHF